MCQLLRRLENFSLYHNNNALLSLSLSLSQLINPIIPRNAVSRILSITYIDIILIFSCGIRHYYSWRKERDTSKGASTELNNVVISNSIVLEEHALVLYAQRRAEYWNPRHSCRLASGICGSRSTRLIGGVRFSLYLAQPDFIRDWIPPRFINA